MFCLANPFFVGYPKIYFKLVRIQLPQSVLVASKLMKIYPTISEANTIPLWRVKSLFYQCSLQVVGNKSLVHNEVCLVGYD